MTIRLSHPLATWHGKASIFSSVIKYKCIQCSLGHRDRPTGYGIHRPYWRRDVIVTFAGHANIHFWCLRCFRQTLGHPRGNVQANIPRPWVWH
jgi:hypothetical protein